MPHVCATPPPPGGRYSWSRGHPRKDALHQLHGTRVSLHPHGILNVPALVGFVRKDAYVRMAKSSLFYKLVLKPRKQKKKVAGSRLHIGDLMEEPACLPASVVVCGFGLRRWNLSPLLALPLQEPWAGERRPWAGVGPRCRLPLPERHTNLTRVRRYMPNILEIGLLGFSWPLRSQLW